MPMHDQVLSFFGLSRLPFGKHLQPADTFASSAHQEALSRLCFGVADEDLLLLTGPIGCGKSVALAAFVAALDGNRYSPLYVRGTGLSAAGLVKAVLEGLKIDPPFFAGQASQLFFKTIGCRSQIDESGGTTIHRVDLIGDRDFGSIGCRE